LSGKAVQHLTPLVTIILSRKAFLLIGNDVKEKT